MAAPAALNTAFVRLGFSDAAAAILADDDKEKLTIEALQYFDDKGVKILCASLRKPGGTIEQATADGQPAVRIPNPGVYVSTMAEINLTTACYMARHYKRASRTLTAALLTTARIERYKQFKEAEEAYKEPDDAMKLVKPDKIMDFIEDWPDHVALYDGQNGRPLSYVIRDVIAVPEEASDPAFGETGSRYASLRDEITDRADHEAAQYPVDNARVFELLNDAVSEHKHVKTWIKPFATTRNGRGAWLAFKSHYRGSSELEAIETAAENKLENLVYRGEKQRYNFETHVSMHRKAHQEIEKATGTPIPEATKVRRLLKSLQVATMAVPVATIRAQDNLRGDFDASVNYLKAFLSQTEQPDHRNVASMNSKGGRKGGKKGTNGRKSQDDKGGSKKLDRYYKPAEWWKLDVDTRKKVIELRKKRNISEISSKDTSSKDDKSDSVSTSQRKSKSKKSVKFTED
jgi:hypothetical protein